MAIWRTTLLSKLIINLLICLSIIFLFVIVYIRKQRRVKTYTPNAFLHSPNWVIYLLLYRIPYLPVREKPIWQKNRCLLAVFLQAVSGCLLPDPLRPAFQGYRVLTLLVEAGAAAGPPCPCPSHGPDPTWFIHHHCHQRSEKRRKKATLIHCGNVFKRILPGVFLCYCILTANSRLARPPHFTGLWNDKLFNTDTLK